MKIAIHYDSENFSFSQKWIDYCIEYGIQYKKVNCYSNSIIEDLAEVDGLMWHWYQGDYRAMLFARQLITAIEGCGKKVFPNLQTCWHFDDKIGQKYLFESLNIPQLPSYVFYEKKAALNWLKITTYPTVFKLRGGAGSANVKLIRSESEGKKIVKRAFGSGFTFLDNWSIFKDKVNIVKERKDINSLIVAAKRFIRYFFPFQGEKLHVTQKGYAYFQDFAAGNEYDTRIIVIGDRAFGLRRYNRKNDFRASGSGNFGYERELFDENFLKIAFEVSKKMKSQCIAYDFIYDQNRNPVIVEISYAFSRVGYEPCPGYWNSDLIWHEGTFIPQYFMLADFINEIKNSEENESEK